MSHEKMKTQETSHPEAMQRHCSGAHRDGFRLVTGSCLPPEVSDVLRQLAKAMDEAQIQLVRALTSIRIAGWICGL